LLQAALPNAVTQIQIASSRVTVSVLGEAPLHGFTSAGEVSHVGTEVPQLNYPASPITSAKSVGRRATQRLADHLH
jgi:hypothetical protein